MGREIPVLFYLEGEYWVAQAIGVEVSSFGPSLDEARSMITEALELYFEDETETPAVTELHLERLHVKAV